MDLMNQCVNFMISMLWYVGKQSKISKGADILGTHITSALRFNHSHLEVKNKSLSVRIDGGIMETTCGCAVLEQNSTSTNCSNTLTIFRANFSDFEAKSRLMLSPCNDSAATAGIKIGFEEVEMPT